MILMKISKRDKEIAMKNLPPQIKGVYFQGKYYSREDILKIREKINYRDEA